MTYKGENETVEQILAFVIKNPFILVIDTGATKTAAGTIWYEKFLESLDSLYKKRLQESRDNRSFRFGNNMKFPSIKEVTIPLELGSMDTKLHVSIVDAHIPLLLGLPDMEKLGLSIDIKKKELTTRTGETFKLIRTENGHLALLFMNASPITKNVEDNYFVENDDEENEESVFFNGE